MLYFIYRNILLFLMRSSILVGGQAVIEGVMMRVPGAYATAVRKTDGTIINVVAGEVSLQQSPPPVGGVL